MAQFYVGEIILLPYTFAPAGFFPCDGRLLAIAEYDTLFNLIGTTYGGDGQQTFGLPDLQGRVPIHVGQGPGIQHNYVLAEKAGAEAVALLVGEVPSHTHAVDQTSLAARMRCQTAAGTEVSPVGHVLAAEAAGVTNPYSDQPADSDMRAATVGMTGAITIQPTAAPAPHENRQPVLA